MIKSIFTREYRKTNSLSVEFNEKVWQNRFWERLIRDEDDLTDHIAYIHYNPVKHGYVENPVDWEFSSIHKFIKKGYYLSFVENNGVKPITELPSAQE
jgi:putative transposase